MDVISASPLPAGITSPTIFPSIALARGETYEIRQVLDGVGVLFLYEGSAHGGIKLSGFREGSTFHRAIEVSQAQDYAFLPAGSPPALILRAFQIVFLRHAIRSCFRVFALGDN